MFLDALPAKDRGPLYALLTPVEMSPGTLLVEPHKPSRYVYFPITALIGYFVQLSDVAVELALVGRDGVVGASAVEGRVTTVGARVRVGGAVLQVEASVLKKHAGNNPHLFSRLRNSQDAVSALVAQAAACLTAHNSKGRFASWLLRAVDLGGPVVAIRQSDLGESLNVRRATISNHANDLLAAGVIDYSRGYINVTDPQALRAMACGCYGTLAKGEK